jgi:hypothetical protein
VGFDAAADDSELDESAEVDGVLDSLCDDSDEELDEELELLVSALVVPVLALLLLPHAVINTALTATAANSAAVVVRLFT